MSKPKPVGEERVAYQGEIIEVVEQDMQIEDKIVTFEKARRSPGVRLVIITPENKIKLTKEYRTEINDFDYRLPGGKVFDSLEDFNKAVGDGADIAQRAKDAVVNEAVEEVGIHPIEFELLGISKNGSTVEWDLYYFLVTKYEELGSQSLEDGEVISIQEFELREAWDLCMNGKLKEDRSVSRLMQFLNSKNN